MRGDERARPCGSVAVVCPRFAHGIAVLLERLAFGSRLSFFLCQEKRDGLRCLAFLFRRVEIAIRAFSECQYGYLPLAGSLWVCAFLAGDLDGVIGERGTGLATWTLRVFAQPHWHCCAFRGEYAGAARPRLRQRVKCGSRTAASLDSLHLIRDVGTFCAARGTRGQRRLARVQFMLGQVVWPHDLSCSHNHLSQAASSGSGHCPPPPDCAKESSTLWTLFTLRRGCVGADSLRRHPGTRVDPPGSDKWPRALPP